MPSISRIAAPDRRSPIGLAYSTKDRVELTRQTVEAAAKEPGCDVFWMDGSATDEGRSLPGEMAASLPNLVEIHHGVVGGPDVAILHSLKTLLARGYEYLGLIENDVLLEEGWLRKVLGLFAAGGRDGLRVGAASGRSYAQRMLFQRPDYGVMFNVGAGMVVFSAAAARLVLQHYRTTTVAEVLRTCRWASGLDVRDRLELPVEAPERARLSTDWFYDLALMAHGWSTLAATPSLSRNIDQRAIELNLRELSEQMPSRVDDAGFALYRERLSCASQLNSVHRACGPVYQSVEDGKYLVYPHQLRSSFPNTITGRWNVIWNQGFGPFTFQSAEAGASLNIAAYGGTLGFLLRAAPDAGECLINLGAAEVTIDLSEPPYGIRTYRMKLQDFEQTSVRLTARSAGLSFYGLELSWPQPWFSEVLGVADALG